VKPLSLRTVSGYAILGISLLAWAALPVLPFLPMEATRKAAWAGGVFIFAEVTWWLAVLLLGKEIVVWFRQQWQKLKSRFRKSPPVEKPVSEVEGE